MQGFQESHMMRSLFAARVLRAALWLTLGTAVSVLLGNAIISGAIAQVNASPVETGLDPRQRYFKKCQILKEVL